MSTKPKTKQSKPGAPKIRPSVFRKAASLIMMGWDRDKEDKLHWCCCLALGDKRVKSRFHEHVFFESLYWHPRGYWWKPPGRGCNDQQARVLALLLAADIAEGGGL